MITGLISFNEESDQKMHHFFSIFCCQLLCFGYGKAIKNKHATISKRRWQNANEEWRAWNMLVNTQCLSANLVCKCFLNCLRNKQFMTQHPKQRRNEEYFCKLFEQMTSLSKHQVSFCKVFKKNNKLAINYIILGGGSLLYIISRKFFTAERKKLYLSSKFRRRSKKTCRSC